MPQQRSTTQTQPRTNGSRPKAEDGTLTIMVGGDATDFERAQPVLNAMGELIIHVGPQGHGSMIKLINNTRAAVNAAGLAEAIVLGQKAKLDVDKMLQVVSSGTGESAHDRHGPGEFLVETHGMRPRPGGPEDGLSGVLYRIISGERRYRAAQEAGLYDVPAIEMDLTDEEALEIEQVGERSAGGGELPGANQDGQEQGGEEPALHPAPSRSACIACSRTVTKAGSVTASSRLAARGEGALQSRERRERR